MDRFTEYRRTPIVVEPLLENNAALVIARMVTNMKFIAGHDEIRTILAELASESTASFKAKSNGGVVFRQGRMVDDGNWNYACILHLVRHSMAQYGSDRHLNAVFRRWPATAVESSNLSMQGDVIEYILYHLKFTGPAIEKSLRDAREALHAAIRSFGDNMLRLMNLCGGKPIQYVVVDRRPDPRLFTTFMLQALKVHAANAESRGDDAAQFRLTFVTTQQNHWSFPGSPLIQAPVRGASSSSSSYTSALQHPSVRASPCVSAPSSNNVDLEAAPADATCAGACNEFCSAHLSESTASEEVCDVAWSGDLVGQYSWEICD